MIDKIWVQKAKENDQEAIQYLIKATYSKGFTTVNSILHNPTYSEDILQEAYTTAIKKLHQLEDEEKFDHWFYKIATNKTLDYMKSSAYRNQPLNFTALNNEDDMLDFETNIQSDRADFQPEDNMDYDALKQGMMEVLGSLPEQQRMAIIMYYYDELGIAEIADQFGVSTNTVKSQLAYGRRKIKDQIETMRRKGTSFYSVAPIPFLLWLLQDQASKVDATMSVTKIAEGILGATTVAGTAAAVNNAGATAVVNEGVKSGAKHSFGKWWSTQTLKVKAGVCVATTAVAGGGIYATARTETTTWEMAGDRMAYMYSDLEAGQNYFFGHSRTTFIYNAMTKKMVKIIDENIVDKNEMYVLAENNNWDADSVMGIFVDNEYEEYGIKYTSKTEDNIFTITYEYDFQEYGSLSPSDKKNFEESIRNAYPSIYQKVTNGNVNFTYTDEVEKNIENWSTMSALNINYEKK